MSPGVPDIPNVPRCPHVPPCSRKWPSVTSLKEVKSAPSWRRFWEWGGIEPGVEPPTSAWCPLLATKNTGRGWPGQNTCGQVGSPGGQLGGTEHLRTGGVTWGSVGGHLRSAGGLRTSGDKWGHLGGTGDTGGLKSLQSQGDPSCAQMYLRCVLGISGAHWGGDRSGRWLPSTHGWLPRCITGVPQLYPGVSQMCFGCISGVPRCAHRGDDSQVGQVAAPCPRVVAQDDVALAQLWAQVTDLGDQGGSGGRTPQERPQKSQRDPKNPQRDPKYPKSPQREIPNHP